MINTKMNFSDIMKGIATVEDVKTLDPKDIRQLLKSADSMINRSADLNKINKADALRQEIRAALKELEGTPAQAIWKTTDPDELSLEEINKAIKQAQWYKHTYGPNAQRNWKSIVAQGNTHPLYEKSYRNLQKAPEIYEQALADEAKWQNIKDNHKPEPRVDKMKEIKQMVVDLEGKKHRSKAEDAILAQLKGILE